MGLKKLGIQHAKQIAINKNGLCLSTQYKNNASKLRWKCQCGHEWDASISTVQNGSWCKICKQKTNYRGSSQRLSIQFIKQKCKQLNIQCLQEVYINAKTKMSFICEKGHIFFTIWDCIQRGHKCKTCANIKNYNTFTLPKKKTMEDGHKYAKDNGGICLQQKNINGNSFFTFQCKCKNIFTTKLCYNTWCKICKNKQNGDNRTQNIQVFKEIAIKRGMQCLSEQYKPGTNLNFRCANGHVFSIKGNAFKHGCGCGLCTVYRQQKIFRNIIEYLTDIKFTKIRPLWLLSKNGKRMQIDGFNQQHNLAFQYQGIQHFQYHRYFHRNNINNFIYSQERDQLKRQILKNKQIILLQPDYTIKRTEFISFIQSQFNKNNIYHLIKQDKLKNINIHEIIKSI